MLRMLLDKVVVNIEPTLRLYYASCLINNQKKIEFDVWDWAGEVSPIPHISPFFH